MTEIEQIMSRPYARTLTPAEEGGYTASVLEFEGCFAEGDTADEAIGELEGAMRDWLAAAIRQGQPIPSPFATREFSGRMLVRMPRSLHERAARRAVVEGVSLNYLLVTAVASFLGAEVKGGEASPRVHEGAVHTNARPEELSSTGEPTGLS